MSNEEKVSLIDTETARFAATLENLSDSIPATKAKALIAGFKNGFRTALEVVTK